MRISSACLLLAAALALPAGAQNVIVNGGFDRNVGGWTVSTVDSLNWSGADATGDIDSGSALLANYSASSSAQVLATQCAPITPGGSYRLTALVRIPSGQQRPGIAMLAHTLYEAGDCTGKTASGATADVLTTAAGPLDTWVPLSLTTPRLANAHSARIQIVLGKTESGGGLQALFDDVSLVLVSLPAPRTITIPSSASIHGANATFFHTDLWVKNRSYENAVTVTAAYRCQDGFTCPDRTKSISLQPRETKLLADVVSTVFGLEETAGAIDLTWDSSIAEISATSRTYTPTTADPTNGTSVPSFPADDATTCGTFLGLGNNGGDRSYGFRTNAGAYNPGTAAATVTFRLVSAGGTVLGETTRTAEPKKPFQINDVFAAVGAGSTVTMNATLDVDSTSPVFPFVTVIDNRSGDSVWVQPSQDEPR